MRTHLATLALSTADRPAASSATPPLARPRLPVLWLRASGLCASAFACSASASDGFSGDGKNDTVLEGGRLVFRSDLAMQVDQCDTDCADVDGDGLVDAWEDQLLERMRPVVRFDEAEKILSDPTGKVGMVARVFPVSLDPVEIHVLIELGYSNDYGTCFGITEHHGDSERVGMRLVALPGRPHDLVVSGLYTAAHEHTPNEHSKLHEGDDLLRIETRRELGGPRWVVFSSRNKHATYFTLSDCESSFIPCVQEDCSPDRVADPAKFDVVPPFVNAGEPTAHRVDDLAVVGFPGDDAWIDQRFCGGLARNNLCAEPTVEKLTSDPFIKL